MRIKNCIHIFQFAASLVFIFFTDPVIMRAQDLKQQFNSYAQQAMQEKLYAHTDKDFYLAGEVCWFKLYNVDAFFNKPLGISKVAYVELLDKNNHPVLQAKLALKDGEGDGSLQLPATLATGKYLLRAYTRWMKNFSADYFFSKTISIVNSRSVYHEDSIAQKSRYDIQFFPEGGNMVNGLQSRMAFRVVNQAGKGVACNGVLVNEKSDTVARYATLKFGLGSFVFTPQQSNTYKAVLFFADSSIVEQSLSPAATQGYTFQLVKSGKSALKIIVSQAGITNTAGPLWLFAHTRSVVKAVQSAQPVNGVAEFDVDIAVLGDGISHLTVFNADRQPVCERLFFKRPGHYLDITAMPGRNSYDTRDKVSLKLGTANELGQPVAADMSVAVYRLDSLAAPDEHGISSYLWLSSDLAGHVESPDYYFTDTSSAGATMADNLMLTQGWRRFQWQNILQHKKPLFEFTPEYKGHIVRGRVISNSDGRPVKDIESYLSVVGSRSQMRSAYSDDSGFVKFEMNHFYGNNEIILQTSGKDSLNLHIETTSPFSDKFASAATPPFVMSRQNPGSVFGQHVAVQVQNAYAGSKIRQQVLPIFDTTAFYARPDKIYKLDDYVRFTTMEEVLREYVPEVNVRKREGKYYLPVFDNVRRDFFVTDPLILLDGVPVLNPDKIMSYDPLNVRKLEVVARMYYYGSMFFGGIINFITYNGDLPGYELDPHATVVDYETLQLQREFFSPVYDSPGQVNERFPDFRSLLYWSPVIKVNKDGKKDIGFYTSDLSGRFAAVLQGITADGKTGSKTVFFDVKERTPVAGKTQ